MLKFWGPRPCLAPFVFDNPLPAGVAPTGTANPRGNSTGDLLLGLTMQSQWISFAVHLDPNFHGGEYFHSLLCTCPSSNKALELIVEGVPYWPDYVNGTMNIVYRNTTEGTHSSPSSTQSLF